MQFDEFMLGLFLVDVLLSDDEDVNIDDDDNKDVEEEADEISEPDKDWLDELFSWSLDLFLLDES